MGLQFSIHLALVMVPLVANYISPLFVSPFFPVITKISWYTKVLDEGNPIFSKAVYPALVN